MKQRDQPRHGAPSVGIDLGVGARFGRREEEHRVLEIFAPFAPASSEVAPHTNARSSARLRADFRHRPSRKPRAASRPARCARPKSAAIPPVSRRHERCATDSPSVVQPYARRFRARARVSAPRVGRAPMGANATWGCTECPLSSALGRALRRGRWRSSSAFSQSPRCRLSFSECALVYGSSTPMSSAGTPPSSRANGSTNGIEPPQPMATASRAVALLRARGTPPGTPGATDRCTTSRPRASAWTSTSTPHGAASFSASMSASRTRSASRSGTMRMPTRAHADSQMMLRASLRVLAWMALTAIDGWRQFISHGCGRRRAAARRAAAPPARGTSPRRSGSAAMLFRSASVSGRTFS